MRLRVPTTQFARQLRRRQTPAEAKLWALLRDRQLAHAKFRRQHPIGPYFADFFSFGARLAVECDGSQHYTRPPHDVRRDAYFGALGILVLRFENRVVLYEPAWVLKCIHQTIVSRAG